jgi:hypothetical protein
LLLGGFFFFFISVFLYHLAIQYYVMLWYRYLLRNRDLLAVAAEFNEFEDPFRGAFPFCQADVIRKATREGLESLRPMFAELERLLTPGTAEAA